MVTFFLIQRVDGTNLGLHAHSPVHQFSKLLRNREAQPRAAVCARRRRVHLSSSRPNSATLGWKAHPSFRRRVYLFCHHGRIQPSCECSPPISITSEFSPPISIDFRPPVPIGEFSPLNPITGEFSDIQCLVSRLQVPGSESRVLGVGFRGLKFGFGFRDPTP